MSKDRMLIGAKTKCGIYFLIICISLSVGVVYSKKRRILNEKKQSMLTPDQVIQDLIAGNKRFYSKGKLKRRSSISLSQKASKRGQFPKAVILACMDSRSIPELIFDQSIADIFTLRVAGNIINDDMLASMEYATKYSGSKVIVVMGHTQCGAIEAACAGGVTGNLKALVSAIKPAVQMVKKHSNNKQLDCSDDVTIRNIALQNVRNMKARVIKDSSVIRELVANGDVKIVGALHDLKSGIVTFE